MYDYFADVASRTLSCLNGLRQRGDNVNEGIFNKSVFPTNLILSGRNLASPFNYDLMEIIASFRNENLRPNFIIEPRAGRGVISPSKEDAIIGERLKQGIPSFITFFSKEPVKGQSLENVVEGLACFGEEIIRRYPKRSLDATGNCSGGWVLELLAATRPDLFGPDSIMITNGTPRSYWYDTDRYIFTRIRMLGGEWIVRLLCDMTGGYFDGANLSLGFEWNDATQVVYDKNFNLWRKPTPDEIVKHTDKEIWWDNYVGFFKDEIVPTAQMFIGNKLERSEVFLNGQRVDIRNTKATRVIFCSHGDSVTSVAQALGFIPNVWKTTQEIKDQGVTIVYCIDPSCGHTAIFVSSAIAFRYHRNFDKFAEKIRRLPPGLWQMIISADGEDIFFLPRDVSDIRKMLPENHEEQYREGKAFAEISEHLGQMYEILLGPWVRAGGPVNQEIIRRFLESAHLMRASRTVFSSQNPWTNFLPTVDYEPKINSNHPLLAFEQITGSVVRNWFDTSVKAYHTFSNNMARYMWNTFLK